MDGKQFVDILTQEWSLQLGAATRSQWRSKSKISPTIMRNALRALEHQRMGRAIEPIVEFNYLNVEHGKNTDSFASRVDNQTIVGKLKKSKGIYAFFKTGGSLVYVGKTESNNLFDEMEQRYWHKKVPFRILKNGKAINVDAKINDVADYFSAYSINKYLITNVEALLTRIIINNASNLRIESFVRKPH